MDDALAFAPIAELATLIRRGELSPLELTDLYLERIEQYDPALNAYLAVTAERARAQARAAEVANRGRHLSRPLARHSPRL